MDEFEQLTSLLGTGENKRLLSLEKRIHDSHQRTQELAEILPAILRALPDQADFISALQAPVSSCVKKSVQQEPQSFVKALLPILKQILPRLTADTLKQVKISLQAQQRYLSQLKNDFDQLEEAYTHQQDQYRSLNKSFDDLKLAYTEQFRPLQALLQTQQNQVSDIESYLGTLEQLYVNQQMQVTNVEQAQQLQQQDVQKYFDAFKQMSDDQQTQLNDLEKYVGNLEKAYVEQHLQLGHTNEQIESLKKAHLSQQKQQRSLDIHSDYLEQTFNTQYGFLNKHIETLEKAQVGQQKQMSQLQEHLNHLEKTQVDQLMKRTEYFEKITVRFNDLQKRINHPKQRVLDVAEILPGAIRQASVRKDITPSRLPSGIEYTELTESLQAPVEICIQRSLTENVRLFADALFPLIGPLIRKSIGEEFKSLLQRINTTLRQSIFSIQGLAWRIQSWRSRQPFVEVVLKNTLAYRVEQVFLIHRESGLLIQHASLEDVDAGDSDAVSAMFTAIQDFIRDSFSASKEEELDSVEVGKYTVWIERGPYAILACVIRGEAPILFRKIMQTLLEKLHARYGSLLGQFAGDSLSLQSCQHLLEELLYSETKAEAKSRFLFPQLLVLCSLIIIAVSVWGYYFFKHEELIANYLNALHNTPGIIVVSTEQRNGKLIVHGLRDPLAVDAQEIARRFKLDEDEVFFQGQAYQDLNVQFVEQRLRLWLNPPDTVQMSLKGTVLYLKGHVDQAWMNKAHDSIGIMAGVLEVITDELVNTDAPFHAFLNALNETSGIIVISSEHKNNQWVITGMRDPLAEAPEKIAQRLQISNVVMRWTPYQDLTPLLIEKRARLRLTLPSTVQLQVQEGVLYLRGYAEADWITQAIDKASTIAGVNRVAVENLLDIDSFLLAQAQRQLAPPLSVTLNVHDKILQVSGTTDSATFQALVERIQHFQDSQEKLLGVDMSTLVDYDLDIYKMIQHIEKINIYFYKESTRLVAEQEAILSKLFKEVQKLLAFSQDLNQPLQLQIIGNTDGRRNSNQQLAQKRAEVVFNWLLAHGIEEHYLTMTSPAKRRFAESQHRSPDRQVSFRVIKR